MKLSVLAKLLPVFLLLSEGVFLRALSGAETPQYTARFWRTQDGLPHNSVLTIMQTPDGYLWIGTAGGVTRFDGVTFSRLDLHSAEEKPASVPVMCEGPDHSLWFGVTTQGVVRWKNGAISWFNLTNGLPRVSVRSVFAASDGTIWVGMDVGLARFRNEKMEKVAEFTPQLGVNAICEDAERNLYLATTKGIKRLRLGNDITFEDLPRTGPVSDVANTNDFNLYTRTLCLDHRGNLWAGVDRMLVQMDPLFSARIKKGFSHDFISVVREDRRGNLWVGTYGGLNQIPSGRDTPVEITNEGDSFDMIYSVLEDREGNIWVGTADGLARLQPKSFSVFDRHRGLGHNNVISVMEDRDGRMCVGTRGGGLNFIQEGKVTARKETIAGETLIMAMGQDAKGGIWLTSENLTEIYCLTETGLTRYGEQDGFFDKTGRVIRQDRSGLMWIGASRALYSFDGTRFKKWSTRNGLVSSGIHDIWEDRDWNLWVATDKGLYHREGNRFVPLAASGGVPQVMTTSIRGEADGKLWLGTKKGIALCHNGRFSSRPDLTDRVFHENILGLLEDDLGNLWMSSPSGIFSAPKKDLEAALSGQTSSFKSMAYGASDGLMSTTCNGLAKPSCWKSRDGRLWFATTKGLAVLDPKSVRQVNAVPPPVAIEEIFADKRKVTSLKSYRVATGKNPNHATIQPFHPVTIPAGRGEIEFHYTALSFTAPEKNQFKYKLEGVDPEWVDAGSRRAAYYNNLKPGSYLFRVIGSNNDGIWNSMGSSIKFSLQPHYWQTWWFKFSLGLAGLSVAVAGARYVTRQRMQARLERLEQQHAIEKERTRIAQDMHDDLGARLTGVLLLSRTQGSANEANGDSRSRFEQISTAVEEAVDNLHAIVWTVNPQNDSVDHFVTYVQQHTQSFLKLSFIRCRFDVPAQVPSWRLSSERRHNLFMVVKEALNNIVKHAQASEVWLRVKTDDALLRISIEDNGLGFNAAETSVMSNGLSNMKKRMQQIGGGFELISEPGKGTRIQIQIPIQPGA